MIDDPLDAGPMLSPCPNRYYDIQRPGPSFDKLPEDLLVLATFIIVKHASNFQKTQIALNHSFPKYGLQTADIVAIRTWLNNTQYGKRVFEYVHSMKGVGADELERRWKRSLTFAGIS